MTSRSRSRPPVVIALRRAVNTAKLSFSQRDSWYVRSLFPLDDPQLLAQQQDFDVLFVFRLSTKRQDVQHQSKKLSHYEPSHAFPHNLQEDPAAHCSG